MWKQVDLDWRRRKWTTLDHRYLSDIDQGFSAFWYLCTPKTKLYPPEYPQIRVVSPSCTPKSKFFPNELLLSGFFFNFAYTLWASLDPDGYAYPWFEYHWFRSLMLCPACLLVLSVVVTNQQANKVALVASTRLVNLKASAANLLSVDLLQTQVWTTY